MSSPIAAWPWTDTEVAERVRNFCWAETPLGPLESWSSALRTAVDIVLGSPSVSWLVCGPERLLIYNDATARLCGEHHPGALGKPLPEAVPEIWKATKPLYERAFSGEGVHVRAQPLTVERDGRPTSLVFDAFLTPVHDDEGRVAYALMTGFEMSANARGEAELPPNEDHFRQLFNSIDEGFCTIEVLFGTDGSPVDYRFLEVNPAFEWHTGLSDAVGKTVRELVPQHEQHWFHIYGRIVRTGKPERFEDRADALGRWYDVYAFRIGKPEQHQVAVLFRDVMERKRAEDAVRRSEERLRSVLDGMAEGFGLMAPDFTILELNTEALRMEARPREQIIGRTHWEAYPGSEDSELGRLYKKAMAERVPVTFEHRYVWGDGHTLWLDMRAYPTADGGLAVFWRDVTERKLAEEALRDSEVKYRSLFERMGQGYCEFELIRDAGGRAIDQHYLEFNPAFERIFGIPISEARGRKASEVFPELEASWHELFDRVARTGRPERIEHPVAASRRWFEVFAYPGGGDRVIVLYEDVTERKRAEISLRESEERNTFLLKLGDHLRSASRAADILEVAARLLGEHLNASRVLFAEFDEERGIAHIFHGWFASGAQPFPTIMRFEDYEGPILDELRQGLAVRIEDTGPPFTRPDLAAIGEIGVKALLSVPLILDGKLKVNVSIHQHAVRRWTENEVRLVREVAERLWADLVRARAEASLKESEERLQLAISLAQLATWDWDIENDRVIWSPEHFRMQGYAVGEVEPSYQAWLARVHPEDRDKAEGALAQARRSGTEFVHTFRSLHPDGSVKWLSARAKFFYNATGEATRAIGVIEDITESYMAQTALRLSEERFRLMAENVRDYAIFMTDHEDRVTDWFPGAAAVYGWQADEIMGKPASVLFTPEDRAQGEPQREVDVARIAGVAPNVRWHLRRDGFRRFIEGMVTALKDTSGEVVGFVKIGQDATARRMTEDALRQSEERFRQFGEASPDVVWVRDAVTLQMEYVSPAFERVYGTSLDQLFQGDNYMSWKELIHPDDREHAAREIERVRQGGKTSFEYRIRRADGSVRWLRNTDFPLRAADGRVIRIGGIGQDITEEKENIERMNVMVRELHHRTRNLIGVVQSIVRQTFRAPAGKEECQALVNERLQALSNVQDLLNRPADEPISLETLLALELDALAAGDHAERITISGPPITLKHSAVQVLALGIHELATNARKYGFMAHPDGRLSVQWRIERADGEEEALILEWIETGVHRGNAQLRAQGYGSQLIERALPYALGGEVSYGLTEEGVSCVFRLPASKVVA